MHATPAGLPCGMPGMGELIEGAMQHAPQPLRHSIGPDSPPRAAAQASRPFAGGTKGRGVTPNAAPGVCPIRLVGVRTWEPIGRARYYETATLLKNMKMSVPTLVTILALSGLAAFQTGCAGTATSKSTGEVVDDATITTKVKAAFVKDPVVKAIDVKVDTFKGAVQLSGFVDTAEQKARAESIAAGIQNVMSVRNNITVKTAAN